MTLKFIYSLLTHKCISVERFMEIFKQINYADFMQMPTQCLQMFIHCLHYKLNKLTMNGTQSSEALHSDLGGSFIFWGVIEI